MAKKKSCKRVYTYLNPENGHKFIIIARRKKQALNKARLECAPGRRIFKDEIIRLEATEPIIALEYWDNGMFTSGPESVTKTTITTEEEPDTMSDNDGVVR